MYPGRHRVLQIGSAAVTKGPFSERGLELTPSVLVEVSAKAHEACGILIAEESRRIGFIRSCLEALSDTAQDFGLAVAVLVPSSSQLRVVEDVIRELRLEPCARVRIAQDIGHAAQFLASWNPGPPLGNPKILPHGLSLTPAIESLLKKSFHDCDRVFLERLGGGRDAADVFCVHAWLKKSIVGPRPLPFFIKFSTPDKINEERRNYETYADFYIPFYLRPNVVPARCASVRSLASLVGNFVEDSVPLRTALRANRRPGVIFSLFETSLRGFRSQPAGGPSESFDQPLAEFVRGRARAAEVRTETVRLARKLGLTCDPSGIENRLCSAIGTITRRFSPYHGDLHSGNVRVRANDAILIDFSTVKHGPLTADPATLEVSLVFGTDGNDKRTSFEEWKEVVDEIYGCVPIHIPPSLIAEPGPFAWIHRAVREIHHVMVGCDRGQEETAEVLAAYLLRFARLPVEQFDEAGLSELAQWRQAYALVAAERVVDSLVAKRNPGTTV